MLRLTTLLTTLLGTTSLLSSSSLTTLRSLSLDSTTFFSASGMEGIVRPWVREVFVQA